MATHHTRGVQTAETNSKELKDQMLPMMLPLSQHKCAKLRVDVKFEYDSTTNCFSTHKILCLPITLIEFYGTSPT